MRNGSNYIKMSVKKIPNDVQCLLSASARVNNYKRAVEELVYNSLDAESTCIAIRIHVQNNSIQVIDNGIGITDTDYKLLGIRYATSKLTDLDTLKAPPNKYGYRGQALANIIEVSRAVKITSRCAESNNTWMKTYLKGKIEHECSRASTRPSKGTTVEISGFLYNLKIQKKFINAFNELQDIKTFLEQLLLVFNNVSISLRDDAENDIVFKMHKNRDVYQTLKSLFDIDRKDVQELQVEKNDYKVKAFIGTENTNVNKNCHWIYLNNKFIYTSNLHRIIGNKFSKTRFIKHRKTKAGDYDKENFETRQFVPFYLIFITCPYYEYDVINSGKQTIVEFKNWTQINNLIEKLVKFYNGDVHSINGQNNYDQKQVSKKEDTRDEVKKIMEKILGKHNKIGRVSQMQNGIKGKKVKRKKRKPQGNISLTKIIQPKKEIPFKNLNLDKARKFKNSIVKKMTSKYYDANIQAKCIKKKTTSKTKNCNKISRTGLKCKCNKKIVNLIEMFKDDSYSIKRRCDELSLNIKKKLTTKDCEQIEGIYNRQVEKKSLDTKTNQNKYIVKKREINRNMHSPNILQFETTTNNVKPKTEKIRSCDLLQTIIKSQNEFCDQESRKENTMMTINKLDVQHRTYARSYYEQPKLTFESHRYNINNTSDTKKLPDKKQFISKQSRDNFNLGVVKHNQNIQIKKDRITKHHDLFDAIRKKNKLDNNKFNRLLNKYQQDVTRPSFTIDVSETDIIEFSKQIRNQVMNDMNSLFDNEDCDKIYSPKSQLNFGINLNVERTYTVLMDTFYNVSQAFNVKKNDKICINETINDFAPIHNEHTSKMTNIIFTPEPQDIITRNVDEPLDICEAILNNSNDIEGEINNNSEIISRQDSSLINNGFNNIDELLYDNISIKSQLSGSKYKSFTRDKSVTIAPKEKIEETNETVKANKASSEKNVSHQIRNKKIDMINNHIVQDNFTLNTRYNFVPKGMSQIFKNCFSKNICSYNLDTEYYENTIYNNFVEKVAVNTEIYEPNVQNVKEFITGDIQRITEKLQKHNADLIFGSDSLRCAKVVLGQVDNKFIAAMVRSQSQTHKRQEFLVFFDQHAVHERIRLEKNLSHYFIGNNWKKVTIDTISLKSSQDEILYLHNHKDKFIRFGLEWTILNNSEILVNAIPEAIKGKNLRPVEVIVKAVKDLILEQMHAIKYLKGNVSLYPQSIMNLVFSEACRYAIKFGDSLSTRDCVELITALADCKTPFQCAHGRPVMAVLVELNKKSIEYKANIKRIKQFKNGIKI